MSTNFHHGPEVIERREGAGIIRDVKSAVTMIVGTAPIHEIYDTAEKRKDAINKRIVIRSAKDAAALIGPQIAGGWSMPEAINAIFNKVQDGQGGGTIIAVNVFDPDKHKDENGNPDPTKVTAADIVGSIDAAGRASGFQLAQGTFGELGYFPKILIAPRFSTHVGVRTGMNVISNKIHAMDISDLPAGLTIQQAIASRGVGGEYNTASDRSILTYPQVKAYDPVADDVVNQPYSQHYAGVIVATDLAQGYHYSPSNKTMTDVVGMERDIYYHPGDLSSETNALNEVGIVTIMNMYGNGYRAYGNRSAAFPSDITQRNFIQTRRIIDMIHESATYYMQQRIDSLASRAGIEQVEEDVNAFLRKKEGEDVLYGGRFAFDREKTTSRDVANGHFYYKLDLAPVAPMEWLTVESYLDMSLIKNALGLTS
ncbi:phage tail sheath subtilisin-like domain-containing protein [Bartonella sp. HY761]|uniref:phage tail sheath subtilisin-like domain-containing protein n=1 Tax=Bartonella sp. HY761 TaxID=2979330 RepID=UPI00220DC818|nr:phage tail sheath subtilisin-like domain-containing protein [Bartonella sp. HY761]UXN07514.1 phage tail sheath subtilisin-like domain-containing protein [Bartonella sp. HY761]